MFVEPESAAKQQKAEAQQHWFHYCPKVRRQEREAAAKQRKRLWMANIYRWLRLAVSAFVVIGPAFANLKYAVHHHQAVVPALADCALPSNLLAEIAYGKAEGQLLGWLQLSTCLDHRSLMLSSSNKCGLQGRISM